MKKRYFAPEVEIIEYNIDNIMLSESIVYGGVEDNEWEDTNEHRGAWDDIWTYME
ncbi:MAG: hypothetical protein IJF06_08680 [Bacteroidaceae bacterium]|nr:hypothetical protein [Bacteroidaceae bacterium]